MIDRTALFLRCEEVEYLVTWYIMRDPKKRLKLKQRGDTIDDFTNAIWLRLLTSFRDGRTYDYKLATLVCTACNWELARFVRRKHQNHMTRHPLRDEHTTEDDQADITETRDLHHRIAKLLVTLPLRFAVVLRYRFGLFNVEELTLDQLATHLKLSRERIRQMEMKSLKIFQHWSRAKKLLPYIDPKDTRLQCYVTTLSGARLGDLRLPSRGYQNYLAFAHPRDGITFRELLHDVGGTDFNPAEDAEPVLLSDRVRLEPFGESSEPSEHEDSEGDD